VSNDPYDAALDCAAGAAKAWLASLPTRRVAPTLDAGEMLAALWTGLPEQPADAAAVIAELARVAEPGLMGVGCGSFHGWVMGGVLPAALAADWLVSAWDQNTVLRYAAPATYALEEVAGGWVLDLLGLPPTAEVGFVTGATMANFTCLSAARQAVLHRVGWDVARDGLAGGPRVRVLVGAERHESVDLALRYLGFGAPTAVPADEQGRLRVDALAEALGAEDTPTVVCLQAGNLHSGSFDPLEEAIAVARRHDAWVHVDGAFGLWTAAAPSLAHLVRGVARADSWATDAHKTLNTPYDCGLAIVADPVALRSAMGIRADYLVTESPGDPLDRVPELSRRARGVPVWAALRALGRTGIAELVERLAGHARTMADRLAALDAEILNDVVYTQVSAAFGSDQRTEAVVRELLADGTTWMSGSRWHNCAVMRVSMSNWSTGAADIDASVAAVARAVRAAAGSH
jgi:glutamate/tyrosine decarboxylase-like PLP-dependent enzyme